MKTLGGMAVILLLLAGLTVSFQNCSNTTLIQPQAPVILNIQGQTNWCLDGTLLGYTLDTFYVRNINISPWQGQFLADTDADGLPDAVELMVGFDPGNPRSRSGVLDSLCFNLSGTNSCPTVASGCDPTPAPLGISACEIQTLGLDKVNDNPTVGLDSDLDGIIDYFEIVGGTDPAVADANDDPDHDEILNHTEYERQSNPLFADANAPSGDLMSITSTQLTGAQVGSCAGEVWQLAIQHVPYAPDVGAFASNSATGVNQPHAAGQNILVAVVKLKPQTGTTGNAQIFYQTFLIDQKTSNLPIDGSSMQLAGEVLP